MPIIAIQSPRQGYLVIHWESLTEPLSQSYARIQRLDEINQHPVKLGLRFSPILSASSNPVFIFTGLEQGMYEVELVNNGQIVQSNTIFVA